MLVLKMMSDEDKSDSDVSKGFSLICCDNVSFRRDGDAAFADVYNGSDLETYILDGNAYVMQNGKTIASFSYSNFVLSREFVSRKENKESMDGELTQIG